MRSNNALGDALAIHCNNSLSALPERTSLSLSLAKPSSRSLPCSSISNPTVDCFLIQSNTSFEVTFRASGISKVSKIFFSSGSEATDTDSGAVLRPVVCDPFWPRSLRTLSVRVLKCIFVNVALTLFSSTEVSRNDSKSRPRSRSRTKWFNRRFRTASSLCSRRDSPTLPGISSALASTVLRSP